MKVKKSIFPAALLLAIQLTAGSIFGDFAGPSGQSGEGAGSPSALESKREGRYLNALPGVAYTPELGFIAAGMLGIYNNGLRTDRLFALAPYRSAITVLASGSTRGMVSLQTIWDAPYFRESPFRIRARISFARNPVETYFGIGETTLSPLQTPQGRIYDKYADFYGDLIGIEDGATDAYFNFYRNQMLLGEIQLERDFLRVFRLAAGVTISRRWIHDYTGDLVRGVPESSPDERVEAVMRPTRLLLDNRAGGLKGFDGGWNNSLRLGIAWDTRDLESDPRRGMFHDYLLVWAQNALGSEFSYTISTLTTRFYVSPFPDTLDLVLAARLAISVKSGDVPFFLMNAIPSTDRSVIGLGGEYTLRGYRLSRFNGPVMGFGNLEARLHFTSFKIGANRIELALAPFLDFGRVFDRFQNLELSGIKAAGGIGLRAVVSRSFVLSMDLGFSSEESAVLYMTFGQIF